jgi:hypothetical protein
MGDVACYACNAETLNNVNDNIPDAADTMTSNSVTKRSIEIVGIQNNVWKLEIAHSVS